MKWFKHQTDASDDIKIKRLEDKFGIEGYGIFFKVIEKVGKEGANYALNDAKYPIEFLAKDFGVEKKMLEECLTFMDEMGLVVFKKDKISIPNMKKYADDYTYRVRRVSVQGSSDVRLEENRIDKNRIDKMFDEFWTLYPRKVSKKKTYILFTKLSPLEELFSKIIEAVKSQKESEQWSKDGGKFIPHPTTWLNQERWNDEVLKVAKQPFYNGMKMQKFNGKWKVWERGQWNDYGDKESKIEWK